MPIAPIPRDAAPPAEQLRAWLARVAWILSHHHESPLAMAEDASNTLARVWQPLDLVEKDLQTVERITANPSRWLREQILPALNTTTLPVMVVELTRLLDECKLRAAGMKIQVTFDTDSRGYVSVKLTEHRPLIGYEPTEFSRVDPEYDDDE